VVHRKRIHLRAQHVHALAVHIHLAPQRIHLLAQRFAIGPRIADAGKERGVGDGVGLATATHPQEVAVDLRAQRFDVANVARRARHGHALAATTDQRVRIAVTATHHRAAVGLGIGDRHHTCTGTRLYIDSCLDGRCRVARGFCSGCGVDNRIHRGLHARLIRRVGGDCATGLHRYRQHCSCAWCRLRQGVWRRRRNRGTHRCGQHG